MIKTILVPVDISQIDAGSTALKLARDTAKSYKSKIVLLNVVEPVPGYVAAELPAGLREKALSDAEARLNEMAREGRVEKIAEVVVRRGHPSTEILEYARESDVDMIVIASHDPGLVDYLLGSVAARVVRHAHCSVLVVRNLEL